MRNEEQNNKPVTGYPYPTPAGQSSNYNNNPYPPAQNSNYTGYPYTAPPPANYYPTTTQPDPQRAAFFRRVMIIFFSICIIFGALSVVLWLVLRPRIPEFQINSATVSPFNVSTSSSQVSGNWDIEFIAKNPNKKLNAYYDSIQGGVFYGKELLSETTLAPFYQGTLNETKFEAKFASSDAYVGDFLSKKMDGERKSGTVNFNVRLKGWVKFRSSTWRTKVHLLSVICEGVSIGFTSNSGLGTLAGGPKKCDVNL